MSDTVTAAELLESAAALYRQRNALYGDNYKRFGSILKALFPEGARLVTADDWNRIGVLVQVVSKLTRYTHNFKIGGHADSLCDAKVYIAMLEELDNEIRTKEDYAIGIVPEDCDRARHGNDWLAAALDIPIG